MTLRIDHLVVASRTLDEGVAWCEATLGTTPGPGGEHPLFGTHNRLLKLQSEGDPAPYLEIIAINPEATPTRGAGLKRWFDLDNAALQRRLAHDGPQLVHWVASVADIDAALLALRAIGIEPGPVVSASRPTPNGLLRWRISVRDDGQRLFDGMLPTLIQWSGEHPTHHMPFSGIALRRLRLQHPGAAGLRAALQALGLQNLGVARTPETAHHQSHRHTEPLVTVSDGPAALCAELEAPVLGRLTLHSPP